VVVLVEEMLLGNRENLVDLVEGVPILPQLLVELEMPVDIVL
jgi:hypothetical protein